jgi:predicted helicase
MVSDIPDLVLPGAGNPGQFFPRFAYEPTSSDPGLFDDDETAGYRRVDNITDAALARFTTAYGPGVSKDDVFFYTYGVLHVPGYRTEFAADLKKMLPRIPLVPVISDFEALAVAGRRLSDLHLGYESVEPYPLRELVEESAAGSEALFRVRKMSYGKAGKLPDRSTLLYNAHVTLTGIPEETHEYMLGSRSALDWLIDRYQVKQDKASGIVNNPNDWCDEVGDPRYIIDLVKRIVTVSVETVKIVNSLPEIDFSAAK